MQDPPTSTGDLSASPVTSIDGRTTMAIAIGGVGGAALRFTIGEFLGDTGDWPWAVFVVNIVGCVALGWLVAHRAHLSERIFAAASIGFCGALTTFSAFAVDLAVMVRDDRVGLLVTYLVASFVCGAVGFLAGVRMGSAPGPRLAR